MVSSTSSPCSSSVKVTPSNFIVNRSVELFRVDPRDPVSRVFAIERPVGGTFVYSLRQPLHAFGDPAIVEDRAIAGADLQLPRSEEHTSELQSLMRISYAVFCLNKKKPQIYHCYTFTL